MSDVYSGSVHDFAIFKLELLKFNFKKYRIWVDSGFLGIKKYLSDTLIFIPHKSSKNKHLSLWQKGYNSFVAVDRVVVEHAISSLKRYHIIRNQHRTLDNKHITSTIELCAGLSNFKNKYKAKC